MLEAEGRNEVSPLEYVYRNCKLSECTSGSRSLTDGHKRGCNAGRLFAFRVRGERIHS